MSVLELHELTSRSGLGLNFFSVACAVKYKYGSVQFNHSAVSDYLQPHGLQHPRPPCPLPTPRVYSNMSTESVMTSKHLIVCCPLLLSSSIFPSIRVFSNESALRTRWPEYWSFSFNISPSNEHLVIWNYAKLV